MKVGILHLSDLHIERDNYLDKINAIVNSCSYDIKQIASLYIVITGDIVKSGKQSEYVNAKEFISTLQKNIKPANIILPIKIVIVPGNHDCCFDSVKATRKTIIKDCIKDVISEEDYFVDALTVQQNFWNFYHELDLEEPEDKISYKIEHQPNLDHKIVFHCYNSSWMSEIGQLCGSIVIPENKFLTNDNGEITISVLHHPLNWLSPNTNKNNKSRFEEHLLNTSNIVLFGHEHDKGTFKNIQQKSNNVVFSEGKAFQKDNAKETGFNYFDINLNDNTIIYKVYSWNDETYTSEPEESFSLQKKSRRAFSLTQEFESKIETLKIPLKHSKKENLLISDVFIYPDLEPIKDEEIIQYVDAKTLLEQIKKGENPKALIEGEDQSGKTTLLFSLYKDLYNNGFIPIYIRGKNTNSTDIRKLIKTAIKEQYDTNDIELFLQCQNQILLFDNLQNTKLNPKHKTILLKNIDTHFKNVIISTNNSTLSNLDIEEINALRDYNKYRILPLGFEKRKELIEQWLQIGENPITIREEEILKSLQLKLDEINSLIGNRLMPSYPIFILTLLQGLDSQIFQDFSQTSYAHCYHALITAGLIKEGLKEELNGYFNLLKELSYWLFNTQKREFFNNNSFDEFFITFKTNYFISHSSSKILNKLSAANILKFEDEYYSFSYKYIYYYLVAQKIASEINQHESLIKDLCDKIYLEESANILIFLSHHSKAQILLDNIIFTSWLPFEDTKPITLNTTDPFSTFISNFIDEIQEEMIKIEDRNPKEEIKKEQQIKDKIDRQENNNKGESNEYKLPNEIIEINQALQTIKILGQIVKNQKGNFEKEKLIELVETAYNSTFRLISFFTGILNTEKDAIIDAILSNVEEKNKNNIEFSEFIKKMNKEDFRKQITKFLQFISYKICIDGLDNLVSAVGAQGVDELYDTVTKKINTPIAKIITFAIKSYYGKIDIINLESLFQDVKTNHIAINILRFYVKKHLYTNNIERTKKERIIQIAGFKPNIDINKRLNQRLSS